MKALFISIIAVLITGCTIKPLPPIVKDQVLQKRITMQQSEVVQVKYIEELITNSETLLIAEQRSAKGWPLPSIAVVVLYEEKLCQLDKSIRNQRLEKLQAKASFANQFDTLLLASCAPDFTPSVLARSLKQVRANREWPASYDAYFNTLERHLQALTRLENLYGNLKEKMNTTIEKLTEIEVQTQP